MIGKITLFWLNTPTHKKEEQVANLTIASLASVLKANNFEVTCVDGNQIYNAKQWHSNPLYYFKKLLKIVEKTQPDVLGFGSWSVNMPIIVEFARKFKQRNPNTLTVLGGYNPTIFPKKTLFDFPFFDILILGEGEYTLLELMQKLKEKKDWTQIRGIAYRKDKSIIINEKRPSITELDKLPKIDYSNFKYLENKKTFYLITSRGCFYSCNYCSEKSIWNKLNAHSNNYIIEQIKLLQKNFGDVNIRFADDLFLFNQNKFKQLLRKFNQNNLNFKWSCFTRIDTLNNENISYLKTFGCNRLHVGLESIIPESLGFLNKSSNPLNYIKKIKVILRYLSNTNIKTRISTIIGSPNETKNDILDVKNFILNLSKIENFYPYTGLLVPYIGTKIWNMYKDKKIELFKITDKTLWRFRPSFFSYKYDDNVELVPFAFAINNHNMDNEAYMQLIKDVYLELRMNGATSLLPKI